MGAASLWLRTALTETRERYPALRRLQVGLRQRLGRTGEQSAVSGGEEE